MLHICGHWTWPGEEGKMPSIKIYSNLDEVDLLLNDRSLGVQEKAKVRGLAHPPFVWQVPLRARNAEGGGAFRCTRAD